MQLWASFVRNTIPLYMLYTKLSTFLTEFLQNNTHTGFTKMIYDLNTVIGLQDHHHTNPTEYMVYLQEYFLIIMTEMELLKDNCPPQLWSLLLNFYNDAITITSMTRDGGSRKKALQSCTVKELKAHAAKYGISLAGCKRKHEILSRFLNKNK